MFQDIDISKTSIDEYQTKWKKRNFDDIGIVTGITFHIFLFSFFSLYDFVNKWNSYLILNVLFKIDYTHSPAARGKSKIHKG